MRWISSARVSRSSGGLRVLAALAFLAAAGCHSLEVTNPDNPDVTRALSSGTDVQSLLGGGFLNWYHSLADYSPNMAWDVAADHYISAWGNWGMRYTGWEPRIYPYSNTHTDPGTWTPIGEQIWYDNYSAVVSANLTLKALSGTNPVRIPGPVDSSGNAMVRAAAKFLQGAAMATVAMAYDSGYALDENTDVTTIKLVGRDSVKAMALAKLDQAIALSTGSWSIPTTFLGQGTSPWTAAQLKAAANTWAARTIAYSPRTATENTSAAWNRVLTYAQNGISSGTPFDMSIVGDGGNVYYNLRISVGEDFQIWERTDFRVLCLMDPTYSCHRPNNGAWRPMPQIADWRFTGGGVTGENCIPSELITYSHVKASQYCASIPAGVGTADFIFDSLTADWPGYASSRGYYRWSPVGHIRYWDMSWASPNTFLGTAPFVLAAENDLLWAEALVRTAGSFATAAAKINNSRVTRGHLAALTGTETQAQMLSAIIYERAIELYSTGDRVAYYDARRWSAGLTSPHYYTAANDSVTTGWGPYGTGLQPGTPRIFPVPAQELGLLGYTAQQIYTYGGVVCGADPNACTAMHPDMVVPAHSIFGTTPDGRVILGPGRWNAIADSIQAATRREIRSRLLTRM